MIDFSQSWLNTLVYSEAHQGGSFAIFFFLKKKYMEVPLSSNPLWVDRSEKGLRAETRAWPLEQRLRTSVGNVTVFELRDPTCPK